MRSSIPLTAAALAAAGLLGGGQAAKATTYNFNFSGTCSEACAANASITPSAGQLLVVLRDTQANPRSAGDLLSSIEITTSSGTGTPSLTSQLGTLITVTSTMGPYTTSPGPPTHWGIGTSGGQIVLETAGPFAQPMDPINMIIGPPDSMGNYSNSNASINDGHFSPYIDQTGTFTISDSAINANTTITAVTFNFGTGPDFFKTGVSCTPGTPNCSSGPPLVPEPSALAVLGTGLALLGMITSWRRKLG